MVQKAYLAVDMGASSGRAVAGLFDGKQLQLEEVYRFENGAIEADGHLFWDLLGQWSHVRQGLRAAGSKWGDSIASVGVDTWGVDFGLLGRGDELLGNPYHYRDSRSNGMMEKAFGIVSRDQIFRHSGLQFMQFNTLYQLLAMKLAGSPLLDVAESFLMIPDLFHWLMTGVKCNEMTDASTTQFYDPIKGDWSTELLEQFSLPTRILGKIAAPGTILGSLRANLAAETGLGAAKVVLPGSHDTASAVMAVPAHSHPGARPDWCYVSLGTWALMGIESPQPVVNDAVLKLNFTNEGGVGGTTRLLKNITGLWLVQECRRVWNQAGANLDWEALNQLSAAQPPLRSFVNPDAADFHGAGRHARGHSLLLPQERPNRARAKGGRAAVRLGEHCPEVPARVGDVRAVGRRAAGDHSHRRRRHEESPALPVRGQCLRSPGRRRAGRGHGHRQRDDAGRGRRRRGLDCRGPRRHPRQFPRRRVRAAGHGGLGRSVWEVLQGGGSVGARGHAAGVSTSSREFLPPAKRPSIAMEGIWVVGQFGDFFPRDWHETSESKSTISSILRLWSHTPAFTTGDALVVALYHIALLTFVARRAKELRMLWFKPHATCTAFAPTAPRASLCPKLKRISTLRIRAIMALFPWIRTHLVSF